MLVLGVGLLVMPNLVFSIFGIEETNEVWIRTTGLLLLGYGAYYWIAVRAGLTSICRASVWVRWGIAFGLTVLALTTGPWQLVIFAAGDLLGGSWTFFALRSADQPSAA